MTTRSIWVTGVGPFAVSRTVEIPEFVLAETRCTITIERLPTEPVGTFELTLTNVVVGSRIHIEKQSDGTQFYDGVAATSTVQISLSAYASGNANNDLRIKVRKSSSGTSYKPFETLATAIVGSQSIYVGQIADE